MSKAMQPKVTSVAIDKIRPNEKNYNRQSDFVFKKLVESIQEFGFVDPVIVRSGTEKGAFKDKKYEIIGGEHRWRAAKELGFTEVMVNDLGQVSDLVAKRLMIVLNETKGRADQDALADLIRGIEAEGGLEALEVLPFDAADLQNIIDAAADEAPELAEDEDEEDDDEDASDGKKGDRFEEVLTSLGLKNATPSQLDTFLDAVHEYAAGLQKKQPVWKALVKLIDSTMAKEDGD